MANIVSGDKTSIQFVLPKSAHEVMSKLAEERTRANRITEDNPKKVFISDIIRDAISIYFQELGIDIDLSVDRGGYRERGE